MSTSIKDLQQTLADGVEGFSTAAKSVKDTDLKILFEGFAAERQEMADELAAYSDSPEHESATITGALHRGWIDLKSAITAGDDHAILAECERGEDHAVAAFEKAVEDCAVLEAGSTVSSIATRILAVHNQVKALRDKSKPS